MATCMAPGESRRGPGHWLSIGTSEPSGLVTLIVTPDGKPVGNVINLPRNDASTCVQSVYRPGSTIVNSLSPGTSTEMPEPGNNEKISQAPAAIAVAQTAIGQVKASRCRISRA